MRTVWKAWITFKMLQPQILNFFHIKELLFCRYTIVRTRRLQPTCDDCAVRVQCFSSVCNRGTDLHTSTLTNFLFTWFCNPLIWVRFLTHWSMFGTLALTSFAEVASLIKDRRLLWVFNTAFFNIHEFFIWRINYCWLHSGYRWDLLQLWSCLRLFVT